MIMDTLPKKRGRPKGVKKGEGTTVLAPIVNWTPFHETVVQLSMANWSNTDIAERFDYHPGRISQILQDPRAKLTQAKIIAQMQEKFAEGITGQLAQLAPMAWNNIRDTVYARNADGSAIAPGTAAKKHQDMISQWLLDGYLPEGTKDSSKPKSENFDSKLAERLVSALERSNEVADLYGKQEIVYEEKKDAD